MNDSKFGLQAGIFTHDMDKAFYAFEHLEVTLSVLLPILQHSRSVSTIAVRKISDMRVFMPRGLAAAESTTPTQVGGVVLGNVPSIRVDSQPYGGVKDSGLGREGIRYAMKDMTEERVLLMADIGAGSFE